MDLVTSCKDKLAYFRIKELKDVLTQLGLAKQGKKQDLVDRILAILSDDLSGMWAKKNAVGKEEVAKLVDDTYRKMQISGATDLASKSDSSNVKLKEEPEEPYKMDKIRCLCGSTLPTDSMIKCEDPRCNVWQHIACVVISEKPVEGVLPNTPEIFYCEICRLRRADPFWVTVAHPSYPVKLTIANVPSDGSNPVQSIEKTFQLTRADKDLSSKQEYDVQAWCMLLNDKVPFRMHWPQYADLQVNGLPVRAINRPGSQLLGANGRDDGHIITPCTRDGVNKISLTGCDSRIFCLGVRIVKRRTLNQVLNMIPKESEGERFEDALARVRRCVGGGAATENAENADSDSDIEVVADFIPVNLRCPMSGLRMKVAGRFEPCVHMGCFDLEVFVEMNQRSRKWQCPICLKNYSLEKIIIDPYFNRIISKIKNCGEDVNEIEVKPDGSWRAKTEGDRRVLGELGLWHLPDGSLCPPMEGESKPKPEFPEKIKKEGGSDSHAGLKLEMKKNRNGCWELNKSDDMLKLSSANRLPEHFENNVHNIIPMSSSATGSGRDGEDASVNQDGVENIDFVTSHGIELESISLSIDPSYEFNEQNPPAPLGEVIILSDSEEENEPLISSGAIYKDHLMDNGGTTFSVSQQGIPGSYPENPAAFGNGIGLFNAHDDDFGMHMWPLPSCSQEAPGFQLFGSDADVTDALVDVQHGSINCPTSVSGYTLTAETAMGSAALVPESSVKHTNVNDGLVDNPLPFSGNDPSLQIFLPTRPSDASTQVDMRDLPDVSNGIRSEDWISLRLGGGSGGGHSESVASNVLSSRNQLQSNNGALDSLADTASLLLGMNDNKSVKTSREISDSPFSFPRQRRSVRPRLYLSIDSDSE
ncbi:E3 SUMO- ligase SIZ1 isoform X1 [Olea europaea subsp. europaea]|uniref:E3 SUMO- ligase SIZ1 isoform X1 n=1 Tax=Olea europaea subsp. europaea TaxID=158383 RepID=A0A8S0SW12_OLEEU|nr:E3 SUMO- ligase SIZ1 isoform X1 [Olea europaea subsp. europaea]